MPLKYYGLGGKSASLNVIPGVHSFSVTVDFVLGECGFPFSQTRHLTLMADY